MKPRDYTRKNLVIICAMPKAGPPLAENLVVNV